MENNKLYKNLIYKYPSILKYPIVNDKLKRIIKVLTTYPKKGYTFNQIFELLYSMIEEFKCNNELCYAIETKLNDEIETILSDYTFQSSNTIRSFVNQIIDYNKNIVQYIDRDDFFQSYIDTLKQQYSICNGFMIRWYCSYEKVSKRIFELSKDQLNRFEKVLNNKNIRFIIIGVGILNKHSCNQYEKQYEEYDNIDENHYNILLIDKKNNEAELFEPHGRYHYELVENENHLLYDRDKLDNELYRFLQNYDIQYISPREYCPYFSFQLFENYENTQKRYYRNGLCIAWCMMWIDFRIQNPNLNRVDLLKSILYEISNNKNGFKDFINNYVTIVSESIVENINNKENRLIYYLDDLEKNDNRFVMLPVNSITKNHIEVLFSYDNNEYVYNIDSKFVEWYGFINNNKFELVTIEPKSNRIVEVRKKNNIKHINMDELDVKDYYFILSPFDKKKLFDSL